MDKINQINYQCMIKME